VRGGAVYSPALTDFTFNREQLHVHHRPDVVKAVMQEEVTQEELGGGLVHSRESGVSHFLSKDDRECLASVRELLSYLPSNNQNDPPYVKPIDDPARRCPELEEIVPVDPHKPYDVRKVIASVIDDGRFLEVRELWAPNMVVGFARLNGYVVGIVANQPMVLAGCIDIAASIKAAHFIRICDAYNIPIVTLQDVPGFLPGKSQEYSGIIRNGARLIYAYSEATVPKLMIILRKSYGGAYCVMSSKGLRGDLLYAWPNSEIAVMGASGAVNILFRNELKNAANPKERRDELVRDYEEKFNNPYVAASRGLIDDVIEPRDTRRVLIRALEVTLSKREKHAPRKHGIRRCKAMTLDNAQSAVSAISSALSIVHLQLKSATMFKKILIANRGEIAVRIIRTCRDLGIRAVALYEHDDRGSLHVRLADEAVELKSGQGYLDQAAVLKAALDTGADAIHPGYAFLAERLDFIEACQQAGVVFIGPPLDLMRAQQDKLAVLNRVRAAGVATIEYSPHSFGEDELDGLRAESERMGFPIAIKSCLGGRGRGAFIARSAPQLDRTLRRAQLEAQLVYGNTRLYVEQLISPAHLIGVQIIAIGSATSRIWASEGSRSAAIRR
jgi:hypothetical protein